MPGLAPGIHAFLSVIKDVDGRGEPGHDASRWDYSPAAMEISGSGRPSRSRLSRSATMKASSID